MENNRNIQLPRRGKKNLCVCKLCVLCVCGSFYSVGAFIGKSIWFSSLGHVLTAEFKRGRRGKHGWLLKPDVPVLRRLFSGFSFIFNGSKVVVGQWRHLRVLGWDSGLWKVIQKESSRVFRIFKISCPSVCSTPHQPPWFILQTKIFRNRSQTCFMFQKTISWHKLALWFLANVNPEKNLFILCMGTTFSCGFTHISRF